MLERRFVRILPDVSMALMLTIGLLSAGRSAREEQKPSRLVLMDRDSTEFMITQVMKFALTSCLTKKAAM